MPYSLHPTFFYNKLHMHVLLYSTTTFRYGYDMYITTCTMELHNLMKSLDEVHLKVATTLIYTILFGIPILVVCFKLVVRSFGLY